MSVGVSGEKPKKPYQEMGADATIENLALDIDQHANKMLEDCGQSMTPAGKEYLGSVAVHWYKTREDSGLKLAKYEIDIKQQFHVGDMNTNLISTGLSALSHTVARNYLGMKMRSTDKADKR